MQTIVSADGLRQSFGRKLVLDGVTFALPCGSVTGLIGENGVGKTTLLRILLGLREADGGESRIFGLHSLKRGGAIRRRLGYVFDVYRFNENITAEEACRFYAPFYPTWDTVFAAELRERLHLNSAGNINMYSKGMRARLQLLLALAHHPELLILDEPFSGLDPAVRADILQLLGDYAGAADRTVMISSHQFGDLERFCERVLLLHRGRICIDDVIDDVRAGRGELTAIFPGQPPAKIDFPGTNVVNTRGRMATIYYRGDGDALAAQLEASGATVERNALDLETIFLREVADV